MLLTPYTFAVINIGLQPNDLYQRYMSVISTTVNSLDVENGTIQLVVNEAFKGDYTKGEALTIKVAMDKLKLLFKDQVSTGFIAQGKPIVAL